MTVLEWDRVGERYYQTGVNKGVLYLNDGRSAVWNGLISLEEGGNAEVKAYYMDGVKILESAIPGDFVGKLSAFTYPELFDVVMGIALTDNGVSVYEQPPKKFNLTYQTKMGNDVDGLDHGYKLHFLYNLFAVPDSSNFETLGEQVQPIEFSWSLTGTPPAISGYRPTVHMSVDSNVINPEILSGITDIIYGTLTEDPRMITAEELLGLIGTFDDLTITDNGDGTWTATDYDGDFISMLDADTFQIEGADATYSDPDTYDISSTNL